MTLSFLDRTRHKSSIGEVARLAKFDLDVGCPPMIAEMASDVAERLAVLVDAVAGKQIGHGGGAVVAEEVVQIEHVREPFRTVRAIVNMEGDRWAAVRTKDVRCHLFEPHVQARRIVRRVSVVRMPGRSFERRESDQFAVAIAKDKRARFLFEPRAFVHSAAVPAA